MSSYSVKTGHDAALLDLVSMTPQPRSTGVQVARRGYAASGAVIEEGNYIILQWSVINSVTDWNTLLSQFGLGSALYAEVTVYAPNHLFSYTRYNGTAIRPQIGVDVQRTNFFIRNVCMVIRDMVSL